MDFTFATKSGVTVFISVYNFLMKTFFFCITNFWGIFAFSQTSEKLVVFYFGASDCGYCIVQENIDKIKEIRTTFPLKHADDKIKFVMVVFDDDIDEGLSFIEKYGHWDEVSIGQRYQNELSLSVLNKTEIPGLPHIVVTRDHFSKLPNNIEVVEKREILRDLVGFKQIRDWVDAGFLLVEK